MIFDIPIQQKNIDFSPESETHEIIQNVITICSTLKGTVPLDREFGIDSDVIDEPVNTARTRLSAEYINAIRQFEPRAKVVRISFRQNEYDEVLPVVTIGINE